MSEATSGVPPRHKAFWWQGSLMTIKAGAEETGGALGLVEGTFSEGFGPPLHVPKEDLAFQDVERLIFPTVQGDAQFVAGPGAWVWGPRGVPHAFKVESKRARALVLVTPGGFERMFEVGGTPASESPVPSEQVYDPAAAVALAKQFGFEVVGPQL